MPSKQSFTTNFNAPLIKKHFKKGAPDMINDLINTTKKDIERGIDQGLDLDGKPFAPLSKNTIASKRHRGSATPSKPLVDTDTMRNTVVSQRATSAKPSGKLSVSKGQAKIGKYQHEGTKPYVIHRKNKKALSFITAGGRAFAKSIQHPGLKSRKWFGISKRLIFIRNKMVMAKLSEIIRATQK